MIGRSEFEKKQIVLLFANQGERLSFKNDNLVVKDHEGKTKFQSTCYRIFAIMVIGNITISSGLIMRARKFCFSIVLMNGNLRVYDILGFRAEGNTLLHGRQYGFSSDEKLLMAQRIIANKIRNQRSALTRQRPRNGTINEAISHLGKISTMVLETQSIQELMGLEGSAAKLYFKHQFNNCGWHGRRPRAKQDYVNSTLDIGYTILFNFMETLVRLFGFDAYKGVLHQEFYLRKSLVCDVVEPFRPLVDLCIRKAISLGRCSERDFECENFAWRLPWKKNREYVLFLAQPLIDKRIEMFDYTRSFYRCLSKPRLEIETFPEFVLK